MAETYVITQLLDAARSGDAQAADRLWQAVYHELRTIAAAQLAKEHGPRTLQPTALVNEAFLRLFGQQSPRERPAGTPDATKSRPAAMPEASESRPPGKPDATGGPHFESRRHFFAAAAEAMRRILVEGARKRRRIKRGEGKPAAALPNDPIDADSAIHDPAELLAVDEVLDKLAKHHPREAEVVKQRYIIGLSVEETADVLGIAPRTVEKDWAFARAWLKKALS